MPYAPFFEQFGKLALKETHSVSVFDNHPDLPEDDYGLIELYCDDENCDCRRVMFDIASRKRNTSVAVVAFGWENASFYRKWYHGKNEEIARIIIQEMVGLHLNSASPQSELAPAILEMVRDVLQDPAYVARLKRHYRMFKEKVDPEHFRKSSSNSTTPAATQSKKRHLPRSPGNA